MYNTGNKDEREGIQKNLDNMASHDPLQFASMLTQMLTNTTIPEIKEHKLAISMFMKNFYRQI